MNGDLGCPEKRAAAVFLNACGLRKVCRTATESRSLVFFFALSPVPSKVKGLRAVVRAFFYSLAGLRHALGERAFQQELALAVLLLPLGIWLGQTPMEQALLIGSLLLVLVVELLNSAVESAIDRVGREQDPLSGRAKDLASAAVFVSILNVLVTWGLLLVLPRFDM